MQLRPPSVLRLPLSWDIRRAVFPVRGRLRTQLLAGQVRLLLRRLARTLRHRADGAQPELPTEHARAGLRSEHPGGLPGNPFGIAVSLYKIFIDLIPTRSASDDTKAYTLGATGHLPRGWRSDAAIGLADSHTRSDGDAGTMITAALFNAAVAAGRTPTSSMRAPA